MSTRKALCALSLALAQAATTAFAQTPGLGRPVSEADVAAWDISVMPDGTGLPPGGRGLALRVVTASLRLSRVRPSSATTMSSVWVAAEVGLSRRRSAMMPYRLTVGIHNRS